MVVLMFPKQHILKFSFHSPNLEISTFCSNSGWKQNLKCWSFWWNRNSILWPYNVSRHNIFSWKYDFQVVSLRTQRKKRVWAFHLDIHWQARVQKTTLASYCSVQTLTTMQSPFDCNGTQYRWICGQDLGLPV